MKITFKPILHNCDNHIVEHDIRGCFNEPPGFIGKYFYCSICKRIKHHLEYGVVWVEDYYPKEVVDL